MGVLMGYVSLPEGKIFMRPEKVEQMGGRQDHLPSNKELW